MKKIVIACMLIQSLMWANGGQSPEYQFMRDTYNHTYSHQKLIEFLSLMNNQAMNIINRSCDNVPADTDCPIDQTVTVTVNEEMAEASEIYFGPGEGYEVGEIITLSSNALTFRKLSDSLFTYAVSLDTSKIVDEDMEGTFTFSWNDEGNIARVYYTYVVQTKEYSSSFILLDRNGTQKMISNGIFDDRLNGGDAGTYIMEVELIDPDSHGIVERLSYFDSKENNESLKEVLSKGFINDINGSVYIDPYGNRTFDENGSTIEPFEPPAVDLNDYNNGAILVAKSGFPNNRRFVVVKAGETVGKYTVVGYIFKAYGNDEDHEYEYEYFGLDELLAEKGAGSDSDQLDIWTLDEENKPGQKVTGVWLTKTE